MATKKESKKNYFDFIIDLNKDKKLLKEMLKLAKKKDLTSQELLKRFHEKGYNGVRLRDCEKMVDYVKAGGLEPEGNFAY